MGQWGDSQVRLLFADHRQASCLKFRMWSAGSTSLECSLIYHLPFSQSLPSSSHEGSPSILLISQRINWFLPWCQHNWRSQALTHCSPFLYSKGCQELLWSYVMLPWERHSTSKLSFSNASKLVWSLLHWSAGFLIWSHGVLQSHGPQTLWHQRPWKTVFPQTGAMREDGITFIMLFISIIITSAPPQIIRH